MDSDNAVKNSVLKVSVCLLIHSEEGLTLETSAPESLYGGQFTLSTQLIKPNCRSVCLSVCQSVSQSVSQSVIIFWSIDYSYSTLTSCLWA